MDVISSHQTYAVIIAVEHYQFNISQVQYAENDARAFYSWLTEDLGVPAENVKIWINQDATATALRQELLYEIRNLQEDNRFIFYYAGHGFYSDGCNKLTTWDTHPTNLSGTTVALKDILFDPLQNSACNKSLIFIDACASHIQEQFPSRDLLSEMSNNEFVEFVRSSSYQAMFFSCSPGEKSYPSNMLKHGIWTYHLLKALKGEVREALVREQYITDNSLQNYLRQVVPEFIRSRTTLRAIQTPWAQISSSNTFAVCEIGIDEQSIDLPLMGIDLVYEDMIFRQIEEKNVRNLPGFIRSSHREPEYHSGNANNFINRLMSTPISEEINTIYERCKDILRLRRRDITKSVQVGGGSLDCNLFRFTIDSCQNPDNPKQVMITRTLILIMDANELPEDFERVFPIRPDEIVIPINGEIDFDLMVEKFENAEDEIGGNLVEDDTRGYIEFEAPDGVKFIILTETNELVIKPRGTKTIMEMLSSAKTSLVALAQANQLELE
ncbi:caspase family protein [Paenibacillus solani]|uniref:caspase family protein n=1 Tax=Paenibacillus solani TaxID=1705565 RepID=UPI0006C87AD8|nr:caspase family protein [Paenibacillus solani]